MKGKINARFTVKNVVINKLIILFVVNWLIIGSTSIYFIYQVKDQMNCHGYLKLSVIMDNMISFFMIIICIMENSEMSIQDEYA